MYIENNGLFPCQGMDCEYRHSEGVRLNPRDCWYWLSGGCLNPACAFRHPVSSYSLSLICGYEGAFTFHG